MALVPYHVSEALSSVSCDSAYTQITGKIISEQDGISLFKIGHKKHKLELPKVDRGREPVFPLSV